MRKNLTENMTRLSLKVSLLNRLRILDLSQGIARDLIKKMQLFFMVANSTPIIDPAPGADTTKY